MLCLGWLMGRRVGGIEIVGWLMNRLVRRKAKFRVKIGLGCFHSMF